MRNSNLKIAAINNTYRDTQAALMDAYKPEKYDQAETYHALRERLKVIYNSIAEQRRELNEYEKTTTETHKPQTALELITPRREAFAKLLEKEQEEYTNTVNAFHQKRVAALESRISAPPTSEMLSTLQMLGMRDNITQAEITSLSKQYSSNYQALRVLTDIAARHGYDVIMPVNFDNLLERTEAAQTYLLQRGESLAADDISGNFNAFSFFGDYTDDMCGAWAAFVRELDGNVFTGVDAPTSPKTTKVTEQEIEYLTSLLKPIYDEYSIFNIDEYGKAEDDSHITRMGLHQRNAALKQKINTLVGQNPDLLRIAHGSPYAGYLSEEHFNAAAQVNEESAK